MRRKHIEKLKGDFEFSRDKFFFHTKGDLCEKIYSPFSKGRFKKKFYYPFDEGRFLREKIFSPFRREILKRESPFEFTLSLKGEKNYQREKILDIPGWKIIDMTSQPKLYEFRQHPHAIISWQDTTVNSGFRWQSNKIGRGGTVGDFTSIR